MTTTSSNFASQVLGNLKNDILNGVFEPGKKLLMSKLKERYSVGTSPLREALSQLLAEDLVVVENQRGFRVSPISIDELEDIYQARAQIESLCVKMAVARGNDDWEAGIIAAAHCLNKYGNGEDIDVDAWQKRHLAFHDAIAEGCGSLQLMQVRQSLADKATRYRNIWLKANIGQHNVLKANQQAHIDIQNALLNRESARAERLILEHLLTPVEIIKMVLKKQNLNHP